MSSSSKRIIAKAFCSVFFKASKMMKIARRFYLYLYINTVLSGKCGFSKHNWY